MIGGKENHHAKEVHRREADESVPVKDGDRCPEHAADIGPDGSDREQDVLVGDAPLGGSPGHADDAATIPGEHVAGDPPGGPGVPVPHLPEIKPHGDHGKEKNESTGGGGQQVECLAADVGFLFVEGGNLAGVADGETEVVEHLLDAALTDRFGMEADEGFFMGQGHMNFSHSLLPLEGVLDGVGTEGTTYAADLQLQGSRGGHDGVLLL